VSPYHGIASHPQGKRPGVGTDSDGRKIDGDTSRFNFFAPRGPASDNFAADGDGSEKKRLHETGIQSYKEGAQVQI